MSNIHDQAMHHIYQQVLDRVLGHMSQVQRASLQLLVQRLLVAAGGPEYIGTFRLLVLLGADCHSARLLAVLRAAQLSIAQRAPVTFQLQVVAVCLPAASSALLEQHERVFSALFLHDDPRVQLQMLEAGQVVSFTRRPYLAAEPWALARDALLVFGHLVDTRPEALLGSRTHLELGAALCLALDGQPAVDAMVTAIPARQRLRYLAWARRGLRQAGGGGGANLHQCMATLAKRLSQLHNTAGTSLGEPETPGTECYSDRLIRLITIDELLPQLLSEGELDLMMECHFEPVQKAMPLASFLDPLALAQLHELRSRCNVPVEAGLAQRLHGERSPATPQASQHSRFAKAYGLERTQLVCMLHSPFANKGRGLERFLQCCHADMLVALPYLHRAMQGKPCPDPVKDWLVNTSGLSLGQLRAIYEGRLHDSALPLLANLARRDVHLGLVANRPAAGLTACEGLPDGA
ncbi:hypothetical protein [Pseudomonas putida]|uniref:Uncharacterized protein n=1 Tax=Pseudomonas putida (strain W619) TaxID=390235 RepID=B1J9Q0_PSEPW|nr:hypothetical protein [Pseudomonas putida]QQE81979.1 hypothetical protein JET17_15095 [Pseudomonas putida]